ncbi:MAG TPA: crosslink repair DNA glycosylase YcaQ family protein [Ktedonobacterales bacterium]|nr:crosslink repair DNA glycosylase YcaQ family protein [Ktedonobacterales bacterium]
MSHPTISKQTARRFILGRQGLWPGRRWAGEAGLMDAMRASEAMQMDPLNVVARSHDIALWGRVSDYQPALLDRVMYERRAFFDYGGGLFIYPMSELPHWRMHMRRRAESGRWADFAAANPTLLDEMRAELRARGPLGNRDFTGRERVTSYRGGKDSALALYHLWLTGETMIHHRQGFERVYDLRERVAPADYDYAAPEDEAEAYFARKALAFLGLVEERRWGTCLLDYIWRRVDREEARRWLDRLIAEGHVAPIRIMGDSGRWLALADDLPLLDALEAGEVPQEWQPLDATTETEVTLLAPLEIVSARGRAKWLFDFDYIWEVYKPAVARRWGYYTLPILFGDRLVARLDPRLDRPTQTLRILGFWRESDAIADEAAFTEALVRGLARFARFLGAQRLDASALGATAEWERITRQVDTRLAVD